MKHFLTLLLLASFFFHGRSQNNIKAQKLITKIEIADFGYPIRDENSIVYKKYKDKIVRFEHGNLRLLSQSFGELWKKSLPSSKELGIWASHFRYEVTDDYIFVFQSWSNSGGIVENISIFRFNIEGEMLQLDLNEKLNFDSYHFSHLNIINGNIYISGNLKEKKDEIRTNIVKFDSELTLQNSHQFKLYSSNDQNNYDWFPYDISANRIQFTDGYWVDSDGKILTKRKGKKSVFMKETIDLNHNLKVIDTSYLPFQPSYASEDHPIFKYNTDDYELRSGDSLVTIFGKSVYSNSMNKTLHLWHKGIQSTDLMNGFFSLIGDEIQLMKGHGKKLESSSFRFNLIDDPINNSVSLILVYGNENFLLTIDKSMKVVCVKYYSVEFHRIFWTNDDYSYTGVFNHSNELVGSMPANHKVNALDFLISNNEPGMFTIINYPDYQLLFLDNIKTKITTGYRID